MRTKLGTACILLGTALVLVALALFLWNQRENQLAGASVKRVLPQVVEEIEAAVEAAGTDPSLPDPYAAEMPEVEIDGYGYIGYLTIPALELELPVMSQWDYTRLKIAPCRYSGAVGTGDLVIAAHNYARHFGPIKTLSPGDLVCFTDMNGVRSAYEVAAVEVLTPVDVEEMTAGTYDLTLFTCTYGGQSRVTVRCIRTEEDR